VLTVVLPLHQVLKARKANEDQQVQKGHKALQELQALLEPLVQQALLALRGQQVLMVQMALTVLMEQQAHKDHRGLRALKVHKEIQD
jgi:hypothetical protein|tara:strand:+ start:568 stop:828 length:261 start_codon:yes stop_codon:yes gene_type:complete